MVDVKDLMINYSQPRICPYCGSVDIIQKYMLKKADGSYRRDKVECPSCHEGMKLKTLIADMSAREWGEWVYINTRLFNSPKFRFYDKMHWDYLWKNLNLVGYITKRDFKDGYYYWKRNYNVENAKKRLLEINIKYDIITPSQSLTMNDRISLGLVLEAYF